MMQEGDLQELAELVSKEAPILSLYLNVDPHRRSTEEHKLNLRRLLAQAAQLGASPADIERTERFFEHEYDRHGRGVACFSCQGQDLWRDYVLPIPFEDFAFVGSRPYVTPLGDVWDAYGRFAVIMVDREGARVLVYHLGAVEDSTGTLGAEVKRHKQGGWAAQKLQRYEDQEARQNLKEAAEWASTYLREHKVTRVVLSGNQSTLVQFRELLPHDLQDQVVGQMNLDMTWSPAQVWDRAFDVTLAAQRQTELDLLAQVVTVARKGGTGALGLDDTLAAMQQRRVYQLLVDREFHHPGSQCSVCQAVLAQMAAQCPYCGGALIETADVVNLAVQQALDAGLKVSVLDHSDQTAEMAGIAAVLRY
jgi:peptide subunit release factor 1 (eRF1)